jgi:hypothetical protein
LVSPDGNVEYFANLQAEILVALPRGVQLLAAPDPVAALREYL